MNNMEQKQNGKQTNCTLRSFFFRKTLQIVFFLVQRFWGMYHPSDTNLSQIFQRN